MPQIQDSDSDLFGIELRLKVEYLKINRFYMGKIADKYLKTLSLKSSAEHIAINAPLRRKCEMKRHESCVEHQYASLIGHQ